MSVILAFIVCSFRDSVPLTWRAWNRVISDKWPFLLDWQSDDGLQT